MSPTATTFLFYIKNFFNVYVFVYIFNSFKYRCKINQQPKWNFLFLCHFCLVCGWRVGQKSIKVCSKKVFYFFDQWMTVQQISIICFLMYQDFSGMSGMLIRAMQHVCALAAWKEWLQKCKAARWPAFSYLFIYLFFVRCLVLMVREKTIYIL